MNLELKTNFFISKKFFFKELNVKIDELTRSNNDLLSQNANLKLTIEVN
jgi:hypothetical protein